MYYYKSCVGVFWIRLNRDGRYVLGIGDDALGTYHSPIHAADDVYTHTTGHYPWDKLDGELFDVPTDIYEWEKQLTT